MPTASRYYNNYDIFVRCIHIFISIRLSGRTILSKFELPRATQTSERAVVYPLSVGEELSKMNALGRGQRERFRRSEVLRHRSTGGPRDEVPNYYACENRILEPSVKSRARKKYHLSAGTNTVKFVYPGRARTGRNRRGSNPERTEHRLSYFRPGGKGAGAVFRRLSLRGYPEPASSIRPLRLSPSVRTVAPITDRPDRVRVNRDRIASLVHYDTFHPTNLSTRRSTPQIRTRDHVAVIKFTQLRKGASRRCRDYFALLLVGAAEEFFVNHVSATEIIMFLVRCYPFKSLVKQSPRTMRGGWVRLTGRDVSM